jgi:hypothetical protein
MNRKYYIFAFSNNSLNDVNIVFTSRKRLSQTSASPPAPVAALPSLNSHSHARLHQSTRGSSLLYFIAALVVASALGAGMASLISRTFMTENRESYGKRAYYLALSGIAYALDMPLDEFKALAGKTSILDLGGAGQIALAVTGPDAAGDYAVASLGAVDSGSSLEGAFSLAATRPGSGTISFAENLGDFGAPVESNPADDIITVDLQDNSINLGNNAPNTYGAIWYAGNSAAGSCAAGNCLFGQGFRAYFQLTFDPSTAGDNATGDGIVFAIINGEENDPTRSGGDVHMGELIGYAGPGKTTDGKGLIPPKIGVEFDIYDNRGAGDPDRSNSRHDGSSKDHVAYVYWGLDTPVTACRLNRYSYLCPYDDNRHSWLHIASARSEFVGTGLEGDQPINSISGKKADASAYYSPDDGSRNWLAQGVHSFRMEVSRATAPNDAGNYDYTLNSWVDCSNCDDALSDYTATQPTLHSTISLNAANHEKFNRFLFGWTMGASDATQEATVCNFKLAFK